MVLKVNSDILDEEVIEELINDLEVREVYVVEPLPKKIPF
jgi:hypothetical protein